jgi:putative (di)nucleoside polyphosphate hydrolase
LIDADGYRPNVGIVLANSRGQLLWAKRINQNGWQFPQGGINRNESPKKALYRELHEEIGLRPDNVEILACTKGWLRYRLPSRLLRSESKSSFVGQKQKWFLLKMLADDTQGQVNANKKPEFDGWRWVSYWYPLGQVVDFKREVYRQALKELSFPHGTMMRANI